MKNPFRKVFVRWVGWRGQLFDRGWRLNGGGFMHGAAPYHYVRIGPLVIRRYM